jgi:methionyl-tRNA formyltransferase
VKIVFFGTPQFAADVLAFLYDKGVDIRAVVTQPDRPKGRSLQLTASAVKEVALARNLPIYQPEKASTEIFIEEMRGLEADLFVVVAFGQILSQKLLDTPPLGCINVHASLLPKYRGAAPIQRCLMAGDEETGIAIQKMVKQLDAGDVIASATVKIPLEMTFGELEKALIEVTKPLLLEVIHNYAKGIPLGLAQDHAQATYASKIELEEGELNWQESARTLHNRVRAFSPRPGAWVWVTIGDVKKRLKVLRSEIVKSSGAPGALLSLEGVVACGEGALKLIEVQPEGKKPMKASDWLRGQKNILF